MSICKYLISNVIQIIGERLFGVLGTLAEIHKNGYKICITNVLKILKFVFIYNCINDLRLKFCFSKVIENPTGR